MLIFVKTFYAGARSGFLYRLIDSGGFAVPCRSKGYRTERMAWASGNRARKRYLKKILA